MSITILAEEAGEMKSNQGAKGTADASIHVDTSHGVLLIPGGLGTRTLIKG
jgi:hypothetical protein